MDFLKNFDWSAKSIAKIIGLFLLGVIALSIVISLLGFAVNTVFRGGHSYNEYSYDRGYDGYDMAQSSRSMSKMAMPLMGDMIEEEYSSGETSEDFEIKEYSGTIKTRHLDQTCGVILNLKGREDVIFETSDKNDSSCYYRFKVKKESADEIAAVIEGLNPEVFNARIETIKKIIDSADDELEILQKKLDSVEDTLSKAQTAYDELTELATRKQDIESLTKIIDSKLNLIEKLTSERISIKERIDRMNKSRAEQLERLNFSYFNINVYEDLIVDFDQMKESWKWEVKEMVRNINDVIQGLTINLVNYLFQFIQVAVYFFISLFLLKGVWVITKRVWIGKKK